MSSAVSAASSASASASRPSRGTTGLASPSPPTTPNLGSSSASTKRRTGGAGANSLLRDYYGISRPSSSTASNASGTASPSLAQGAADGADKETGDVTDPDSKAFDVRAAYRHAISNNDTKGLLRMESSLLTEIRELDGERQSLVYNHHHELVSASETIRKMKARAESLTPSFDSLRSNLLSIRDLSSTLQLPDEVLPPSIITQQGGRSKELEEEMLRVASLPQKLADLIVLGDAAAPATGVREGEDSTLEQLAREAERESEGSGCRGLPQAERLWGQLEDQLAAWQEGGVPGVKEVIAQCRAVLRDARERNRSTSNGPATAGTRRRSGASATPNASSADLPTARSDEGVMA